MTYLINNQSSINNLKGFVMNTETRLKCLSLEEAESMVKILLKYKNTIEEEIMIDRLMIYIKHKNVVHSKKHDIIKMIKRVRDIIAQLKDNLYHKDLGVHEFRKERLIINSKILRRLENYYISLV